jgi:hypothetical protein
VGRDQQAVAQQEVKLWQGWQQQHVLPQKRLQQQQQQEILQQQQQQEIPQQHQGR